MRSRILARISQGWLGLALAAPSIALAQGAGSPPPGVPAGAVAPSPSSSPAPAGYATPGAPEARPAVDPGMPPGEVVACDHSQNGPCAECRRLLALPGQFVTPGAPLDPAVGSAPAQATPAGAVATPGTAAGAVAKPKPEAPGRAVASSDSSRSRSFLRPFVRKDRSTTAAPIAPVAPPAVAPSGEPEPVGVIQANYARTQPMPTAPGYGPMGTPTAGAPGRAVAESNAAMGMTNAAMGMMGPSREPYQAGGDRPHPHILGHIFGWSLWGADRAEEKARRKAESHAMIAYDSNGQPITPVSDLPASAVYGQKR